MPIDSMLVEKEILRMDQEFFMNIEELGTTSIEVALYWCSQLIRVKSISMNEEFTLENGQKLGKIENGHLVFYKNTKLSATIFSNGKSQNVIPTEFLQKGLLLKHGQAVQLESGEFSFHINPKMTSELIPKKELTNQSIFSMLSFSFFALVMFYFTLN